jgi:uncharacterized protein
MKTVFADTLYWVAVANPNDQWHEAAVRASRALVGAQIITTDEVLIETANFFSEAGATARRKVAHVIRMIFSDPSVFVVPQSREGLIEGLALYENRLDKGYSLTDSISMLAMRERGISEVLTHDDHFKQEGFTILL